MKILFIWPGFSIMIYDLPNITKNFIRYFSKFIFIRKPLTFPILAALTPKDYSIDVVEGGIHDINFNKKYDLVGISCTTPSANLVYEIADKFREKKVPVVLGGIHPSVLPKEAKQHADSVVIGEAEDIWPELLKDFENNNLKPFYEQKNLFDLKSLPYPSDIYPKRTGIGIQATRGCPRCCDFCSISNIKFGNIYRMRPIDDVVNELKLYPEKLFVFQDNSLTVNLNYTKKLFRKIKGLNKKFLAYGNINVLGFNDDLLKLASDAGCVGWLIGYESVCQKSLDSVGKKTNQVNKYSQYSKKIHDYGMMIEASFVFGFDYDTPNIFIETDEFVRKNEFDIPFSMVLIPYPGTPIFNRFENEGRILSKDWSKYNGKHVVFKPKLMSAEDLLTGIKELNNKWHSYSNSFRRIIKNNRMSFYTIPEKLSIEIFYKIINKKIFQKKEV